jgi:predicted RNA-binding Zn-ribbon protein involved in translation (DUF1610 family)
MTGARWTCPKCGDVILEGDVPYREAVCRRTIRCTHQGGTPMTRTPPLPKERHD